MADRFAALAGFDAASNYDSTMEQSTAAAQREELPGLETVASIHMDLPASQLQSGTFGRSKNQDRARRLTSGPNDLRPRDRTPPPQETSASSSNKENAPTRAEEPPSTQRKQDPHRRYNVRIADEDTLEELEDSLQHANELHQMQQDLSQGVDSMLNASPVNDSGQWGSRAMRRRSAAGVSMKSAQERINSLTQERDELKIVVDLLREKVNPDDRLAELIVLKKEKLSYTNKLIAQQAMLKQQDRAIKVLNSNSGRAKTRLNTRLCFATYRPNFSPLRAGLMTLNKIAITSEVNLTDAKAP